MSQIENNTKIPKSVGSNNLVETFGKINLSPEVKEFLSAIDGHLTVTYNPGSVAPSFGIVGTNGKNVCSIDEFLKLGMYRRWVNDELKELDKTKTTSQKLELISFFIRHFTDGGKTLPDRMNEGNETRFRQFFAMTEIVEKNLKKIDETVNNSSKDYLVLKMGLVIKLYHKLMLACLDDKPVESSALEDGLFKNGIPKWIHSKSIDKNFTANLRHDSVTLLFPKGNYTKAIAFTKRELKDEDFLATNQVILGKSGSIIALSRHDYSGILPEVPNAHKDDFAEFLQNHMWVLNSPYTTEEILESRLSGKSIPTFKERQMPNVTGNKRPETDLQRLKREAYNTLMRINVTWLSLQNFVIPLENPKDMFWSKLVGTGKTWDISPTHNLYQNLVDFGTDLSPIRELTNDAILKLMAEIVCVSSKIVPNDPIGEALVKTLMSTAKRSGYMDRKGNLITDIDKRLNVNLSTMKETKISEKYETQAKTFLGIRDKKLDDKDKDKDTTSKRGAIRLTKDVLFELSVIKDHAMYPKVKEWISTTFKTGDRKTLQVVAARYVVGEVLKYQDKILGADFDEFDYLRGIDADEDSVE